MSDSLLPPDVAALVAEAKNYEGDNGTARWPSLIRELAAALVAAYPSTQGYTVELGDQRFTEEQWEAVQHYADGRAFAAVPAPADQSAGSFSEGYKAGHTKGWQVGFDDARAALPSSRPVPSVEEAIRKAFRLGMLVVEGEHGGAYCQIPEFTEEEAQAASDLNMPAVRALLTGDDK